MTFCSFTDVEIDVPEFLDLTHLRAQGILPNEELLPAEGSNEQAKPGLTS